MTYKMYLLDIHDLEDKSISDEAMTLIDDKRKKIANKYCKEKDRLRAIAAGLLLQIGFYETEFKENDFCALSCKELIHYMQSSKRTFPIPIEYGEGEHGKPFWNKRAMEKEFAFKKHWFFNLSHSGQYVVLITANQEVGVDIQEEREIKRFPGGYQEFSRMEAFVKCTGNGYAHGYQEYKKHNGSIPGYKIENRQLFEKYVLSICYLDNNS